MGIERIKEFWPEWEIENILGEGSYGKVYKAVKRDKSFSSYSAIKLLSVPSSTAEFDALCSEGMSDAETKTYLEGIVEDFANEIKLMETLKGAPHIVAVEDYKILERNEGIGWDIFIRMELLESFKDYSRRALIDENEVLKLGIELSTALEICRDEHIIHRDIKPANIFISRFKEYKIGDFGVAKELEKTTGAMSAKGTFSYMAPEVARGLRYDATVDIYSLGIVMYTLLNNNRQPFIDPYTTQISYNDRKSANDRRLSGEKLPAPCNASRELADIILCACAYDPKARFSTPAAFKNALLNYKSNKVTPPSPAPAPKPANKEYDPNETVAIHSKPHPVQPPVSELKVKEKEPDPNETVALHRGSKPVEPPQDNLKPHESDPQTASVINFPFMEKVLPKNNVIPPEFDKKEEEERRFPHNEKQNPTLIFEAEQKEETKSGGCLKYVIPLVLAILIIVVVYNVNENKNNKRNSSTTENKLLTTQATKIENDNYTFAANTLTVHNTSDLGYFNQQIRENTSTLIIENGNTDIPDNAFDGFKNVKTVSLPKELETIGKRAFADCVRLEYVVLPDTVKSIGKEAFTHCTSLKSINLPNGLRTVGSYAFNDCQSLNSITLPSISKLESYTFYGCASLKSVTVPSSVTSIGSWAFGECTSLKEVRIEYGTRTIGAWAFEGCDALETIYIPNSIKVIDDSAFKNNSSKKLINGVCIICTADSYAKEYASKYNIPYTMSNDSSLKG